MYGESKSLATPLNENRTCIHYDSRLNSVVRFGICNNYGYSVNPSSLSSPVRSDPAYPDRSGRTESSPVQSTLVYSSLF